MDRTRGRTELEVGRNQLSYTVPKIIWINAKKPSLSRLKQIKQYTVYPVFVSLLKSDPEIILSAPTVVDWVFIAGIQNIFGMLYITKR